MKHSQSNHPGYPCCSLLTSNCGSCSLNKEAFRFKTWSWKFSLNFGTITSLDYTDGTKTSPQTSCWGTSVNNWQLSQLPAPQQLTGPLQWARHPGHWARPTFCPGSSRKKTPNQTNHTKKQWWWKTDFANLNSYFSDKVSLIDLCIRPCPGPSCCTWYIIITVQK